MSAYLIAQVDITDPVKYDAYRTLSSHAIQHHGAEVLVRGGRMELLEGSGLPQRMVVLKFPSIEKAQAFYASDEYVKAREARAGAAVMHMVAVEGL